MDLGGMRTFDSISWQYASVFTDFFEALWHNTSPDITAFCYLHNYIDSHEAAPKYISVYMYAHIRNTRHGPTLRNSCVVGTFSPTNHSYYYPKMIK